jgi:hypothetical protein
MLFAGPHGSGVLIQYRNELFLVSCRHVVEPALEMGALKIATAMGAVDLGTPIPRYWRGESETQTADFAVVSLGLKTGPAPLFLHYDGLLSARKIRSHMPVEILGFPSDSMIWGQPPKGKLRSIEALGFEAETMEEPPGTTQSRVFHQYAMIDNLTPLAGMSGGLVITKELGITMPFGILTSDTTGRADGVPMRLAQFVSFADIFEQ